MIDSDVRRLIGRKRDGGALSATDWHDLVASFVDGTLDRAQFSALLMAVVFQGLNTAETIALTRAMVDSGETLAYPMQPVIDKHSSGGVGDSTSLVVVPWAAAGGVRVAKLAGRALGHTGGTIDKLESIPQLRTTLAPAEFIAQIARIGCAIAAQTANLVPADKAIYALRDQTATVPSVGLIAASIVSKKIATGADAIVYDVKVGRGAFMQTLPEARELAHRIIDVTHAFKRRCRVIISDMDEPLGRCLGDQLEMQEALAILANTCAPNQRLMRLSRYLVAAVAMLGEQPFDYAHVLQSGAAAAKMDELIGAQGGTLSAFSKTARAKQRREIVAAQSGYIAELEPVQLGEAARRLTASGESYSGIELHGEVGSAIEKGAAILTIFGNAAIELDVLKIRVTPEPPALRPLVFLDIDDAGQEVGAPAL